MFMRVTESLCYIPETNTFLTNYTPIQNKKLKKIRKESLPQIFILSQKAEGAEVKLRDRFQLIDVSVQAADCAGLGFENNNQHKVRQGEQEVEICLGSDPWRKLFDNELFGKATFL